MTFAQPAPPVRFRDVTRAEITKIITHPATLLGITATFIINLCVAVIAASEIIRFGSGAEPAPLSAFPSVMFAPVYVFLIVAAHAAGSEHISGQHRITLAAVPRRGSLAAAKFLGLAVVTIPAALIVLFPARLILNDASVGLVPSVLDISRWVFVYFLMSTIAFGLTGSTRSTAASLTVLILIPILIATGVFQWARGIRFLPDQAAMSLLGTPAYDVTELPPVVAAIVLIGWALIAIAVHTALLIHRDA